MRQKRTLAVTRKLKIALRRTDSITSKNMSLESSRTVVHFQLAVVANDPSFVGRGSEALKVLTDGALSSHGCRMFLTQ